MGVTDILTRLDNGNANLLIAQKATLSQTATLNSLSFYVVNPAGSLFLGLYSGSAAAPGSLLAATPVFTPVAGWNTVKVVTPVALQPGTYWLSYLPSSNALSFEATASLTGIEVNKPFSFAPLPGTFPAQFATEQAQWSFYATLTPVTATPTPTTAPTPTPTPTPISVKVGVTKVFTIPDNGNANLLLAQPVTLSQTATLRSLSFYVTTASGQLRLGVYNSSLTQLLAQTIPFTPVPGWNTANVITPVSLSPGTYCLAYLPSSNALAFVKGLNGTGNTIAPFSFGAMPSAFPLNSRFSDSYQWSFYATFTAP
jgi:hypothetical protein